jgi:hypothetical protein
MSGADANRIEVKPGLIYVNRPGYYFGYGLESEPTAMQAIVGHNLNAELGVVAMHKQLVVQEIDQIPDQPVAEWGGKSAQQVLADGWRKHTTVPFSAYALRNSDNRSDVVSGTLYEISQQDAHTLNAWDFANADIGTAAWRHWDHLVELADGRIVSTLTIGYEQEIDRTVPGTHYDPYLNDIMTTINVIHTFHKEL